MVPAPNLHLVSKQSGDMQELLNLYWGRDEWDIYDSFFDPYRTPVRSSTVRHVRFSGLPGRVADEVKFFLAARLESRRLTLRTAFRYGRSFACLADFLAAFYPDVSSLAQLPQRKVLLQWHSFLADRAGKNKKRNSSRPTSHYESALSQALTFFNEYYDTRDEWDKDEWNLRTIPGAMIAKTQAAPTLKFEIVPTGLRMLVKRYAKIRIGRQISPHQCWRDVKAIGLFLTFVHQQHPDWLDLSLLSRKDMEDYLVWLAISKGHWTRQRRIYVIAIRAFLAYIQTAHYPEAPTTPIVLLLQKEDIPREPRSSDDSIKYIPENVLQQLETQLEHLTPTECIPIVVLLRASGWRVADILNLRYDTCLDRTDLGWYLCGDITKTQVLGHRIPITNEVAAVVQAVVEETKEKSTPDNNPDRFLFVRTTGRRKGLPPLGCFVSTALNRLAQRCQLVDLQGQIFHFGNHAFRHTKAVELINNGMSLVHVQKWLAHYSPEMTLRYARLLDTTMREEWERVTQQGLFRFDVTGKPTKVTLADLANGDIIEWEYMRTHLDAVRVGMGICMKPIKMPCGQQLDPCLTCPFLCTTPAFLPEFEHHIQDTQAIIDRGKALGRTTWVEKNQTTLIRLETITRVLRAGKTHHKAGKRGREYGKDER